MVLRASVRHSCGTLGQDRKQDARFAVTRRRAWPRNRGSWTWCVNSSNGRSNSQAAERRIVCLPRLNETPHEVRRTGNLWFIMRTEGWKRRGGAALIVDTTIDVGTR